jgi:antitoxin (DNA-binding transcriptional repressor) of toxin-antitoxin stability system
MRDHKTPTRTKRSRKRPAVQQPVGVRELKTHASRILREVRDSGASFVLTHRGKAIGMILPLSQAGRLPDMDDDAAAWANFWEAGRRLENSLRPGDSPMRALFEMRSQR